MNVTESDTYRAGGGELAKLAKQPEYEQQYVERPRICTRPSCDTVLTDPLLALCQGCQDDLDGTLAEIVALQAEAKKERLARQGAQA